MHLVKLKQFDAHPCKIQPSWDYFSSRLHPLYLWRGEDQRSSSDLGLQRRGPCPRRPGLSQENSGKARGEESPSLGAGEAGGHGHQVTSPPLHHPRADSARLFPRRPRPLGRLSRPWPSAAPPAGRPDPGGCAPPSTAPRPSPLAVCPACTASRPQGCLPCPHGAAPAPPGRLPRPSTEPSPASCAAFGRRVGSRCMSGLSPGTARTPTVPCMSGAAAAAGRAGLRAS